MDTTVAEAPRAVCSACGSRATTTGYDGRGRPVRVCSSCGKRKRI